MRSSFALQRAERGQALRRRIILAVIFLAVFVLLLRIAVLVGEFDAVITAAKFETPRDDPTALRTFLYRMPKGGDLHTHLSGAVYAERFIAWAAQEGLCVDLENIALPKAQCERTGVRPVSDAMRDQKLYDRLVNAFSMRDFLPTPAAPTGHDEFFATFDRLGTISGSHFVDMTLDQLKLYDSENVQYVEFMVSSWCPNDRERFTKAVGEASDDASKLAALEANGLADCVAAKRNDLAAAIGRIKAMLGCDTSNTQPGCGVTFRYIVQVYRNNAPDEVFVQAATAAALIRAEPQLVALNLVGAEDHLVARRDYTRHMQIIGFLASDVPVALHAGELWLGLVPPLTSPFTSAKPSRSAGLVASAMASRLASSAMRRACSPRCARGRSSSRSTSPAMTSSWTCAARRTRCPPISRPGCRSCCPPTMPASCASISPMNISALRATMASVTGSLKRSPAMHCAIPFSPRRKSAISSSASSAALPNSSIRSQAGSRRFAMPSP